MDACLVMKMMNKNLLLKKKKMTRTQRKSTTRRRPRRVSQKRKSGGGRDKRNRDETDKSDRSSTKKNATERKIVKATRKNVTAHLPRDPTTIDARKRKQGSPSSETQTPKRTQMVIAPTIAQFADDMPRNVYVPYPNANDDDVEITRMMGMVYLG